MKTELINEINRLVVEIREKHPELYKYLDEESITLPDMADPEVEDQKLREYIDYLKSIPKKYGVNKPMHNSDMAVDPDNNPM
ncbi:MAG: hypothetical protein V4543_10150 [Bacteroidota bacterium]